MPQILLAHNLHKSFGSNHAVKGISLALSAGELYGLVGPDGAGKTTTLRLLCGALTLDAGSINIDGFDMQHQPEDARAQIGYLSQRFSLYEELTVIENLRFFAELRGMPPQAWVKRTQEILEFVGLAEFSKRLARQLSGGMKQKLGLAIALVNKPRLLMLDEPTTGVDPVTRQDFWQLIIRLAADEQITVLVSTPYMDEAARCTRVGFLRSGQMTVEGSPRALCARLQDRIIEVSGVSKAELLCATRAEAQVETCSQFGSSLHLRTAADSATGVCERLAQAFPNASIKPIQPQLEDVFIHLAGEGS